MPVIRHERVSEETNGNPISGGRQKSLKSLVVSVVLEEHAAPDATIQNVVVVTAACLAPWPRHRLALGKVNAGLVRDEGVRPQRSQILRPIAFQYKTCHHSYG